VSWLLCKGKRAYTMLVCCVVCWGLHRVALVGYSTEEEEEEEGED